ncbi:hypothetical protein BDW71DRAFT_164489 [Aspergillus fruticulosus]
MFALLDLPTEIRTLILQYALLARRDPPSSPSKTNRSLFKDLPYRSWRYRLYQEHTEKHCPSNALPLLLTSRQIYSETRAILDLPACETNYHLDISMLNEIDLYPTWLCVPQATAKVSTLYADIRLFGHIISLNEAAHQTGDGGHLGFHWSFYALLERFLAYGPVSEKKDRDGKFRNESGRGSFRTRDNPMFTDRHVTIDTLILSISDAETQFSLPPSDVHFREWWGQHHNQFLFRNENDAPVGLAKYRSRPIWVAEHLGREIHCLLGMGSHHRPYGEILYERIRRIKILVEGELHREFDLVKELEKLREHAGDSLTGRMRT